MVKIQPAIYVGTLRHRRFLPKPHQFIYPIFMVCLDVDRISEMMSVSPFTGHNRWNWASFFDEDHFGNSALALRERLARVRQEQGLSLADRLLAIGRDCAARLKEPFRSADHGDLLYDDRGLPR